MGDLYQIHVTCAYLTGAGFILRGMLALKEMSVLRYRAVRTVPHVIDTILLVSALTMLHRLSLNPMQAPWLLAKISALLAYIGFGFLMLRFGRTQRRRCIGFVGGLGTYVYIVGAAHSKSTLSWIALWS